MRCMGDIVRERNILQRAIDVFGSEHQQLIAIEEMSELQKELCKRYRGMGSRDHIIEEIADVQIMLDQLMLIFGCRDEVKNWMTLKMLRLEDRIDDFKKKRAEGGM